MITQIEGTGLDTASRWNAAHLPIMYRFTSNIFPVNTLDNSDAYSMVSNDNGYAKLTYPVSYNVYEPGLFVTVEGSVYNGIYLIRSVDVGTITIDAPYSTTDTGTVIKHYNNYHVRIKVYTGVPAGHPQYGTNPIAYRGTEYIVPNIDGVINFDVSTWARVQLLSTDVYAFSDTSVNDLNAWTGFYIAYAESYDAVLGGDIVTNITAFTEDPEVYYAINAKLPFQYNNAGNMGEYTAPIGGNYRSLLTNAEELVYFTGTRSVVSAIVTADDFTDFSVALVVRQYDQNGNLLDTGSIPVSNNGEGVYRIPLHSHTILSTTDYLEIQMGFGAFLSTRTKKVKVDRTCSRYDFPVRWLNNLGGWETYVFKGLKDYEIKTERNFTTRDTHVNWPDNFSDGDTETDLYNITPILYTTIRTLKATKKVVDWTKEIFYSIKVYKVLSDKLKTILVDGRSIKLYRDRDKLYEMEIDVRDTDTIPVQAQ